VVVIVLWSSWFTVQPEETGIVQRFGRVVRTASPGLHFKWPYGIETADEEEMLKEIPAEREEEIKKEITRAILTEARKIIPQYGIELIDVRIKRLDYIESVREKVYARMISERKRIAAQFRSEGEGHGAEILGTMEKDWREIRSSAYRQV
jgi:regulator of protease activity HflC (stomatin/prohibitin superfamily)